MGESKCILFADCDSMGHLGGLFEKHFTQEACPMYHNVSIEETKQQRDIRVRHDEERQKATILFDPMSKEISADQHQFQTDIDEMRAKFVPRSPEPAKVKEENDKDGDSEARKNHINSDNDSAKLLEPCLDGFAPDYDLQLFRQAQAAASEKIETDLLKFPAERGTK